MARPRHARRRPIRLRSVVASALAAVLAASPLVFFSAGTAEAAGGVRKVGEMPLPAEQNSTSGSIIAVDAQSQLLYYIYGTAARGGEVRLRQYATRTEVPQPARNKDGSLRDTKLYAGRMDKVYSSYTVFHDPKRKRLGILAVGIEGVDHTVNQTSEMLFISTETLQITESWPLAFTTMPGWTGFGVTYSELNNEIYVVGEPGPYSNSEFGKKPRSTGATVIALDPETGKLKWARLIRECGMVLRSPVGSLIAATAKGDRLYFACGTGSAVGAGDSLPGEAGAVRMSVGPGMSQQQALATEVKFFPISGVYVTGVGPQAVAAFDPDRERLFIQSIADNTPGAWVLDGIREAWLNFVAARYHSNFWTGFNRKTGHFYMGGVRAGEPHTAFLQVTDGRATPIPTGSVWPYPLSANLWADGRSNRLFAPFKVGDGCGVSCVPPVYVLRDETPDAGEQREPSWDTQTKNLPDVADNYVFFNGSTTGFGVTTAQIGGVAGLVSGSQTTVGDGGSRTARRIVASVKPTPPLPDPLKSPAQQAIDEGFDDTQRQIELGSTQGIQYGTVPSIVLGPASASASAVGLSADERTRRDYVSLAKRTESKRPDNPDDLWPYKSATCLDGGDDPTNDREPKQARNDAKVTVTCDLTKYLVKGASDFDARRNATDVDVVSAGGGYFDGGSARTVKDGVYTNSTASARGVEITVPGVGALVIGETYATAKSGAHGRPGTASATWSRRIQGVRLEAANGSELHNFGGCASSVDALGGRAPKIVDTCLALATQINSVLPERFNVRFPLPDVTSTPKGAFAGVRQAERDYRRESTVNNQGLIFPTDSPGRRQAPAMQVEMYMDGSERARTLVQLATLEATSIFTVSDQAPAVTDPPLPEIPGGTGGPGLPGGPPPLAGPVGNQPVVQPAPAPQPTAVAQTPGTRAPQAAGDTITGLLVSRRTAGQAALMALVLVLFTAAAGSLLRRRALVTTMRG